MAGEWQVLTVDQIKAKDDRAIAIGPFGSRMKADTYVSSGVPVIRGNNISDTRVFVDDFVFVSEQTADELRACNVFSGDLVFPHRGAIGQVGIIPEGDISRFMLSTSLMKLTCNRELVDPLFVFYFFRSALGRHALLQHASTVGTPGIGQPLSSLRSIQIPVPPLPEQHAIAHVLGTLDGKIELNRNRNETLEAMVRALFKDWFIDFGPVRSKMEGSEPYLPGEIWHLFPERLGDEERPEGWCRSTLAEFASLNPESWSRKNIPIEIEYVDLANTKWGTIEAAARMPWAEAPSRAQRILRYGDTIVGTVRPGNGSYAFIGSDGLTGSTGFAVLRPIQEDFREFVFLSATSKENIERLAHLADGAAYPAVRPEVVLATPVSVPEIGSREGVLDAFSKVTKTLLDSIEQNKRDSLSLVSMRDALLPKLISGELRIKDAERIVGVAL
ncbi:restriction endonuclease subunit S [Burkholderia anthina]|uniref:restriction endonuclease subunit S n=1 Tax=Burkholderia anthina TaxID=179879 RepID=UPI00158A63B2|nr:restriction endonuclease subunit S [Burkholderia anthina]